MKRPDIREWPGYIGAFTREYAEGAIPSGRTVVKQKTEPGDANADGALGTVLGSIDAVKYAPDIAKKFNCRFFYFVEWKQAPGLAVGVSGLKLTEPS